MELIDQISDRVAQLERFQDAEKKSCESATSVAETISSLATRIQELEMQPPQSWPLAPSAVAMQGGQAAPMMVPAPGFPGMFMYGHMAPHQLCQSPQVAALTPEQWAAVMEWVGGPASAAHHPGVAAAETADTLASKSIALEAFEDAPPPASPPRANAAAQLVAGAARPPRAAKWRDPAFGTVCLEPEERPRLVPQTRSGLPGAVPPAREPPEPGHKRRRAGGGRRGRERREGLGLERGREQTMGERRA